MLLISLGVLVVGFVGAVVLAVRSGETRAVAFVGLFALLAARQGIVLRSLQSVSDTTFVWGAVGAAEAALASAGVIGVIALAALWRTLSERDRAESLHWNSMEAVRILGEVAARPNLTLDEKLDALLEIGCDRFDLEVGLVSRVDEDRYEVVGYRAPDDFPLSKGAVLMLADTYCTQALASTRPVAFENLEKIAKPQGDEPDELGFRAYFGVAVRVYGENLGTLCFGSRTPRSRRFTATDKDLLNLMAQWVGSEFERRFAIEERKLTSARAAEHATESRPVVRRHEGRVSPTVDVNAALRRSEKKLRDRSDPGVSITIRLADESVEARRPPLAIGAIVESIVAQVAAALGERGEITIDTANLEVTSRDPDLVPAIAPDRYVTTTVTAIGEGIAADSFAHAFEPPVDDSHRAAAWDLQNDLPLATIYRVLQRSGGDLSVEIEPGRCCTFTIFLPAASAKTAPARRAESPPAPAALD
jgi:hypothetical protein